MVGVWCAVAAGCGREVPRSGRDNKEEKEIEGIIARLIADTQNPLYLPETIPDCRIGPPTLVGSRGGWSHKQTQCSSDRRISNVTEAPDVSLVHSTASTSCRDRGVKERSPAN